MNLSDILRNIAPLQTSMDALCYKWRKLIHFADDEGNDFVENDCRSQL